MRIRSSGLYATAIAAVVAAPLFAPRAEACSFLERTIQDVRFSVDDGDTVPQNLVLFSDGIDSDDGSGWWLVGDDEAIRLDMTVTSDRSSRFEPTTPLSPSTTYRLRWSSSAQQPPPVEDDGLPVIAVTTIDDDNDAPATPTVTSETQAIHPDPFSTCGPGEAATWARFFVAPDDNEDAIAAYQLFDDTGLIDQNVVRFGTTDDEGFFLSQQATDGGTRSYRIVALDHAGNESAPTVVDVGLGCPGSCSSADLTGISSLAALLLLARRRRRTTTM